MHRILIAAIALSSCASVALGQDNLLRWFDPDSFDQLPMSVGYDVEHHLSRSVRGQRADLKWTAQSINVLGTVWSDDANELSMTARLDVWHFDTGARFPDTGERFPSHFWDVRVGANYRRLLDEGRMLGARVEVGSPSDSPFASYRELSVDASGFYRLPAGDDAAWLFMLNYSNMREFLRNVPLPGAAWHWRPDKNFELLAGVPRASLRWRPAEMEALELSAYYMMLRTVHGRLGYRLTEGLELYGAFDWSNRQFLRRDRPDKSDRLFFYSKQLRGGAVWRIARQVSLEGFAGYAFDSFFFEGEKYGDRDQNRLDVSDGAFGGLKLRIRL